MSSSALYGMAWRCRGLSEWLALSSWEGEQHADTTSSACTETLYLHFPLLCSGNLHNHRKELAAAHYSREQCGPCGCTHQAKCIKPVYTELSKLLSEVRESLLAALMPKEKGDVELCCNHGNHSVRTTAVLGMTRVQRLVPWRRMLRNYSKNEMRTEKKQVPWLGSQVIKHWDSSSNKRLLLIGFLFIICWIKTNGGYRKQSGFSWKVWEVERLRKGKGPGSQQLLLKMLAVGAYVGLWHPLGSQASLQMICVAPGVEWRIRPHSLAAEKLQWHASWISIRNMAEKQPPKSYSFLGCIFLGKRELPLIADLF